MGREKESRDGGREEGCGEERKRCGRRDNGEGMENKGGKETGGIVRTNNRI